MSAVPVTPSPAAPRRIADGAPVERPLADRLGRRAADLRVSLTDRCGLRCTYCLPADGVPWLPRRRVMTDDEVIRLVRLSVMRLGVRKVRLTGGEPLLRPGLVDLVARIARLRPRPMIAMTTNGVSLAERAADLRRAGLDRLNVSLDALDPDVARAVSRRPLLPRTLAGVAAARAAGVPELRVNTVLMRGVNTDQAVPIVRWALDRGITPRFIEQMPLDAGHGWRRDAMVTAAETLALLGEAFTLRPVDRPRGSDPAASHVVFEGDRRLGEVGIIASVTAPFCAACSRTRLTADGRVRACLFSHVETDLLGPLRDGADDDELERLWRGAQWAKPAAHGIDRAGFVPPRRPMSAIGG